MFGFLYFCDANNHRSYLVLFAVITYLSDGDMYVCVCVCVCVHTFFLLGMFFRR